MKRVPTEQVKDRSRRFAFVYIYSNLYRLTKLFESYNSFSTLVDQQDVPVWVTEIATDGNHLVAHTKNYVQVLVPPQDANLGVSVRIDITAATKFSVFGKVKTSTASTVAPVTEQPPDVNTVPLWQYGLPWWCIGTLMLLTTYIYHRKK